MGIRSKESEQRLKEAEEKQWIHSVINKQL